MNRARTICTTILFAGISFLAGAQTTTDFERLDGVLDPSGHMTDYSSRASDAGGRSVTTTLFILYKKYISSQDGQNCVFHPSCSSYALQSVNQKGLFIGGLAAIDRLTRCHGFSTKQYPVHPESKRLYDPVR